MSRRPLSSQLRVQIVARDEYRCLMCGRARDEVPLEVDHVVPVANGGTDELNNLATLCRDCNRGKSAYQFTDYRQINIVPSNLATHYRPFQDPVTGDFERFHLYLYVKLGIHPGGTDDKYHHSWTISRSQLAASSNSAGLVQRKMAEETIAFTSNIRAALIAKGKRLVLNEEGVCEIDG